MENFCDFFPVSMLYTCWRIGGIAAEALAKAIQTKIRVAMSVTFVSQIFYVIISCAELYVGHEA